jgi:EAL domain-containing protein (putative c-di-GMP-specific phosphodiesterase class I)
MVSSFSDIFKKADYQILYEGVEDESDEARCVDVQAEHLQGYKYSKPIPIEELKNFLEKKKI